MTNKFVVIGLGALIALAPLAALAQTEQLAQAAPTAPAASGGSTAVVKGSHRRMRGPSSKQRARASAHHMHKMRTPSASTPKT